MQYHQIDNIFANELLTLILGEYKKWVNEQSTHTQKHEIKVQEDWEG